ncbi:acid-sensing ion channel 5-like [Anneissia japonica]|uniref:acid-sensing ion channel 5-like n=1 Tax=Anneissia japonica TaxID=1529436 RepID=UPI0014256A75|nr:acid-sensing ion channel 5-like [Anneissia japonica]
MPKAENLLHNQTNCNCRTACHYVNYVTKLSSALWPGDHIISHLKHVTNHSAVFIKKNYLDVYLFYEDLSYEVVEQVPAYTSTKLLCDIGGLMGLLCGMSLMTIIEIIEFSLVSLRKCFNRSSRKIYNS